MSYILDALKKLEHDKSRKSRKDGVVNLSGALFEAERPTSSGVTGWKIAFAVTVAVLVTFAATWQFSQSGKRRETPPSRSAGPAPLPVAVENAPAPSVPPVVPVQNSLPAAAPPAPAPAAPVRPPIQSSKSQKAVVPAATASGDDPIERTPPETRSRAKERKGQSQPADQTIAAPADIKLSGIAWQEDRRARRAVVNGFLMQEGGVVSGARITDIFQDRVRFSFSGSVFEIPLTSSGIPATGK
jgi:general secretion pathway protein B